MLEINLKIFQLNNNWYEFKDKSPNERIELIRKNHLKILHSSLDDEQLKHVDAKITHKIDDDFEYWSYCYNQPKDQHYWHLFLPEDLSKDHKFAVTQFSFVLFVKYKTKIYCLIGGSGKSVIGKYVIPDFGIQVYKCFAEPTVDVLIELQSRGIASNIAQRKNTYNFNQTIAETLDYTEIPTKIKLELRNDLKKGIFKNLKLSKERTILEVGSYFQIRKRLDFDELKILISDLDNIIKTNETKALSLFNKINVIELIEELDSILMDRIVDDIIAISTGEEAAVKEQLLNEVVHPKQLEKFYECGKFIVRRKYSQGKEDIEIENRSELYITAIKHINNTIDDIGDRFKIKGELYKLDIKGYIDERRETIANFYAHITSEVMLAGKKYFRIDAHWYYLNDAFLKIMNDEAIAFYSKYKLNESILNPWNIDDQNEDNYNKSHTESNYFVLDKVIRDNIELCDILHLDGNNLYFIHVKKGFDATMRDLYIQVILAAKRLSTDLRNEKGSSYLRKTLQAYVERNPATSLNVDNFVDAVFEKRVNPIFVMAFRSTSRQDLNVIKRIEASDSNIAKYSLVQTVKEMPEDFELKIIDIAEIK